jgi:hypothetical protein
VTTAPPTASFNSSAGPGPTTVTLLYPPSTLTNVTNVAFGIDAFEEPGLSTASAWESVPQVVDPPNSAAVLKAYKAFKAKHQKHQKHQKHLKHLKHHR